MAKNEPKPLGRPPVRGSTSMLQGTRLDVRLTEEESTRYRNALQPGETLSTVVRSLLDRWAKRREEA